MESKKLGGTRWREVREFRQELARPRLASLSSMHLRRVGDADGARESAEPRRAAGGARFSGPEIALSNRRSFLRGSRPSRGYRSIEGRPLGRPELEKERDTSTGFSPLRQHFWGINRGRESDTSVRLGCPSFIFAAPRRNPDVDVTERASTDLSTPRFVPARPLSALPASRV
ncbi:hypothetical protein KM043_001406 [Ampulex compressa]|nr:hypothetical protein KM043_001406 [Ampulex compressa]